MNVREHTQRRSSRSQSYWKSMARRSQRTSQESEVADMLRAVGFSFKEQWALEACGEGMIIDFSIEEQVLVECTYSNNPRCWNAWQWLKRRATYHDYKFRLAKQVGTFTTISLLEATGCTRKGEPRHFPYPQTIRNLQWTDHIISSIPALGEHLIGINLQTSFDTQPTARQEVLSQWLAAGTKPKPSKAKQSSQTIHPPYRTSSPT